MSEATLILSRGTGPDATVARPPIRARQAGRRILSHPPARPSTFTGNGSAPSRKKRANPCKIRRRPAELVLGGDVIQKLAHWLEGTDFNGVRGEKALAGLPEAERADWQKLWQEVEALRQWAAGPPGKAAAARP